MTDGRRRRRLRLTRRGWRASCAAPALRLGLTLSGPLLWLLVAYIGALVALLMTSLYHNETVGVSTEMVTDPALDNYRTIIDTTVYRDVAVRTIGAALAVTVIDLVIALPGRVLHGQGGVDARAARARHRRHHAAVGRLPREGLRVARACSTPRAGFIKEVFGVSPGYGIWGTIIVLVVPLAAVHGHPASTPGSTACRTRCSRPRPTSAARRGARSARWCCRCWCPSIVAGSIFTFSLTLGDFYVNRLLGGTTQFIGNNIYSNFGVNLPLAAAYATVPILIMVAYLLAARAAGALEEL